MKTAFNFRFAARVAAFSLFVFSMFAVGCRKDDSLINNELPGTEQQFSAGDRTAPVYVYGVTVMRPGVPSQIVRIDAATGAVAGAVNVIAAGGVIINDVKGIYQTMAGYHVTTGSSAAMPFVYRNRVLLVDPNSGVVLANVAGTGVSILSDDCYDPLSSPLLYSLLNNSNNLVETDMATWVSVTYPLGLAAGYTARGLTFAVDPATGARELLVVASNPLNSIKLYHIDLVTRAAIFVRDIAPAPEYIGSHCGAGFFIFGNHLTINRNTTCAAGAGLNDLPYPLLPLFPHPSVNWGGAGFNFEDLCTVL